MEDLLGLYVYLCLLYAAGAGWVNVERHNNIPKIQSKIPRTSAQVKFFRCNILKLRKNEKLKVERGISFEQIVMHIERGECKQVDNFEAKVKKHQEYARSTLKKDKRVNIRISSKVLKEIQALAV